MTLKIRDLQDRDLPRLLEINNAAQPAVNELDLAELSRLAELSSHCLVAEDNGFVAGLLLCVGPGQDYKSPNYVWFSEHLNNFAYVDRICLAKEEQGKGIGEKLYQTLEHYLEDTHIPIVCEVNTRPANEGSLRFHDRLGFRTVGEQDLGTKAVVYLRLDPSAHL